MAEEVSGVHSLVQDVGWKRDEGRSISRSEHVHRVKSRVESMGGCEARVGVAIGSITSELSRMLPNPRTRPSSCSANQNAYCRPVRLPA